VGTDTTAADTTLPDTTLTDSTLVDSTLIDSTLIDSTLIDRTLMDSTPIDSTLPDTFSTDMGPTSIAPADTILEVPQGNRISPPHIEGSATDSIKVLGGAAASAGPDTLTGAGDSTRTSGRDSVRLDTASIPRTAADSILRVACGSGAVGSITAPGSVAQDLLLVVFAPRAGAAERAAAARTVNGKLIGQLEPGSYYLRVPTRGSEAGLRIAANQLSLLPQVRQVGSRACPATSRDTTS
jgi:hypothetical protein